MPDLTGPFVDFSVHAIGSYGLVAIFILMAISSACIPIPSEVVLIYGGFLVSAGQQSFAGVVITALLGILAGSLLAYWLGYAKGREWLLEIHWLHITEKRLDFAERWFQRYENWAVALIRNVPLLRAFISLPAGIARMPLVRFCVLTVVGSLPFVIGLTLAGQAVGANWKSFERHLHVFDYIIVAAVIVAIVWLVVRNVRGRGDSAGGTATS
jgi:membrane protein DedA with SNARE-associated domain